MLTMMMVRRRNEPATRRSQKPNDQAFTATTMRILIPKKNRYTSRYYRRSIVFSSVPTFILFIIQVVVVAVTILSTTSSSRTILIDSFQLLTFPQMVSDPTRLRRTTRRRLGWNNDDSVATSTRKLLASTTATTTLSSCGRVATTKLFMAGTTNKLWDRLQIEEDEEPMWYLLNCVATNEIDLLRQCRTIFQQMELELSKQSGNNNIQKDVIKFVVPIERKTRSHGANKMVTEIKVKYPGYVFANLRLCPYVYEAIQNLDLCRSWMGTVNHKGYKKLPPVPLALNEDEIENFGLEDVSLEQYEDDDDDDNDGTSLVDGVIVDSSDNDDDEDDDSMDDEYSDPMYKNVDKKSLKQYKGLKVEDMVKVIQKGKFYNEDGIVRRLKDGQIFVRFYTYGTMYEEWLAPTDVRKLSPEEVLRGLSGSSQPVTQQDFERTNGIVDPNRPPIDIRNVLQQRATPPGNDRNRRQDRIADRYRDSNSYNPYIKRDADRNWDWYKEQQQNQKKDNSVVAKDTDWTVRAGSRIGNHQVWDVESDVDSQWGRTKSQRQERKDMRKVTPSSSSSSSSSSPSSNNSNANFNKNNNRLLEAAIDGTADWSAFVTSSSSSLPPSQVPSKELIPTREAKNDNNHADDFFASLMSDLKKDLSPSAQSAPTTASRDSRSPQQSSLRQFQQQPGTPTNPSEPVARNNNANDAADDFFSSLLSDLNTNLDASVDPKIQATNQITKISTKPNIPSQDASSDDDDFFASLLSDLKTDFRPSTSNTIPFEPKQDRPYFSETIKTTKTDFSIQQDDDFFASLESELESSMNSETAKPENAAVSDPPLPNRITPTAQKVSPIPSSDLSKKTIPALKDMLRERGLKVGGTKSELIERLLNA